MKLSVGFDIVYDCPKPTPMILTLSIHYSRVSDLLRPDALVINPPIPIKAYRDGFGNWCSRIVAPKGEIHLRADSIVSDPGTTDRIEQGARQHAVQDLPEETLVYLRGVATARPTAFRRRLGRCSTRRPPAGVASRPSVISSTSTSSSATSTRGEREPHWRRIASARGSVEISPTWRSPSVAA
jgi:hypothetical protein